jgi:hypothetical protein
MFSPSQLTAANVNKLQAVALLLADHLDPGKEDGLSKMLETDKDPETAQFLEDCRMRLRGIAEGNAKRMNEISYFVEAVSEVRNDVVRRQQAAEQGEEGEAIDYEAAIHGAVERIRDQKENDGANQVDQHALVVELRTRLGEKIKSDDDDDLEIVNNRTDDVHTLKCPITGMFFEDPVKNKVCHHTYSRHGLQQLIKNRKTTCPVAGCGNKSLSLAQVEEDVEMVMKVKRFKQREEQAEKQRKLEEDDEEVGEGGFTMIQ